MKSKPFNMLNVQEFNNDLINGHWDATDDMDDIELAWQTWSNLFMDTVNLHIPICKKKIITNDIVKLIKERDQIHLALHWRSPYFVNIFARGRQSEVMKPYTAL